MTKIRSKISDEIKNIFNDQEFKDWLNNENVVAGKNNYVVLNNSFMFREDIKTTKSKKYIGCKISDTKIIDTKKIFILEGLSMNSNFKIQIVDSKIKVTDIDAEIKTEISNLGDIVFILIGEIEDTIVLFEEIQTADIKKLWLRPSQVSQFEIIGDEVSVNSTSNREFIYLEIEKHLISLGKSISKDLPSIIDRAISSIEKDAYCNLIIPSKIDVNKKYLLDDIEGIVTTNITDYDKNLPNISSSLQAYNEILRISYNFVSDVSELLNLLINVCDLKPLILWLTISEHYKLDKAFRGLTLGYTNKKQSLKNYESIIKKARNKSFHKLFPFNKTLQVDLPKGSLKDVKIRLFTDFGSKNDNQLMYKDRELANIFLKFTRTSEQLVSDKFWQDNSKVMKSTNSLIKSTSNALKLIKK